MLSSYWLLATQRIKLNHKRQTQVHIYNILAIWPTPHKVTKSQRQSLMTQYQRLCSQTQTQYSHNVIKLCLYN